MDKSFFAEARKCAALFVETIDFSQDKFSKKEIKVIVAYLLGMLTMLGSEMDASGSDVQSSLVAALVHQFGFGEREAGNLAEKAIDCTERENHPTEFTVIKCGLEGFMDYYRQGRYQEIKQDIHQIFEVLGEFSGVK
ncbi:Imm48 family immunity protein [Listeria costaricensis]|uniref:Imm48 family immunity protein n=1 Tax=Listeria costaricensis TaxID=2026604 RepID=UPI000C084962|nr:Imm48 family immunity protein [Listeria costaricensis]